MSMSKYETWKQAEDQINRQMDEEAERRGGLPAIIGKGKVWYAIESRYGVQFAEDKRANDWIRHTGTGKTYGSPEAAHRAVPSDWPSEFEFRIIRVTQTEMVLEGF